MLLGLNLLISLSRGFTVYLECEMQRLLETEEKNENEWMSEDHDYAAELGPMITCVFST
jgi:hypothetical protein